MADGRLTTHVLDTAAGRPAANLKIELFRLAGGAPGAGGADPREMLTAVRTNADGRTDAPLLKGEAFTAGVYEILFHAGDYLKSSGREAPAPVFLDIVPVRFGIAAAAQHYHVPLLLSPFGYSTYRGS